MKIDDFEKVVNGCTESIHRVLSTKGLESDGDESLLVDRFFYIFNKASEMLKMAPEKALAEIAANYLKQTIDIVDGVLPNTASNRDDKIGNLINYLILLKSLLIENERKTAQGDPAPQKAEPAITGDTVTADSIIASAAVTENKGGGNDDGLSQEFIDALLQNETEFPDQTVSAVVEAIPVAEPALPVLTADEETVDNDEFALAKEDLTGILLWSLYTARRGIEQLPVVMKKGVTFNDIRIAANYDKKEDKLDLYASWCAPSEQEVEIKLEYPQLPDNMTINFNQDLGAKQKPFAKNVWLFTINNYCKNYLRTIEEWKIVLNTMKQTTVITEAVVIRMKEKLGDEPMDVQGCMAVGATKTVSYIYAKNVST